MISTLPTISLKRIRIPNHYVIPTLLTIGVATAFFTTAPWPTLTVVGALYIGSIPVTIHAAAKARRAWAQRQPEAAETSAAQPAAAAAAVVPPFDRPTAPAGEWRH